MGGLACLLFLDLATAPVAPWWVTVGFLVLWAVLFGTATRWFVPRPGLVPLLPLLGFVVWLPTIALGVRNLGWS
jgi:hypothetical protein